MNRLTVLILLSLAVILTFQYIDFTTEQKGGKQTRYVFVIHGGAGDINSSMPDSIRGVYTRALREALLIGKNILDSGGTALDAVESAVRFLEDNPEFNAGRGSVLNAEGNVEMDASIMSGKDLSCGAVAGVRTVKNPISLARMVMEKTDNVLFAGRGAEMFADRMNVPRRDSAYFVTPEMRAHWAEHMAKKVKGTVGAVALDLHGDLAAATSTGGRMGKPVGRVGDSPLVNAGTYANNKTCAVSCTGWGEKFIKNTVAFNVSAMMEYKNFSLEKAASEMIQKRLEKNDGGLIAVDRLGNYVMEFSTPGMFRGVITSDGIFETAMFGK